MARVMDMTALKKQLEALERAAQAAQRTAAPTSPPPVLEGNLRSARPELDDNDEGVSMEGPQDKDRIAASPVMQRTVSKAPQKHNLIGDPKQLRRAIILSEILSPPVSRRR